MAYGKTNVEALKADDGKNKDFPTDDRFFMAKDKKTSTDLVFCPPYALDLSVPELAYKVHYKLSRTVICLGSFGEPCPVCDVSWKMRKRGQAGNAVANKLNIEIYPRDSYYYNVIPYVQPAPLPAPIMYGNMAVSHVVGFAPPAEGVKPAVKIFRCGKKAHAQIRNFLQFNGDIFDPMCCNILNLSFIQQASQAGGSGEEFWTPMLNARPQKCQLHAGFLKMLEKAGTKVEDGSIYDLKAVLLEQKPTREEMQALIDAKVAETFAVATGASVAVPVAPFGGGPRTAASSPSPSAPVPTPPNTSLVVGAPPAMSAVPTVTPAMVTAPAQPAAPAALDPLAAFEKGL
jgi:hypothetical protein